MKTSEIRLRGRLVTFFPDKSFGFIRPIDALAAQGRSQDVFVHSTQLQDASIRRGDDVTFALSINSDGRQRAVDVERAG